VTYLGDTLRQQYHIDEDGKESYERKEFVPSAVTMPNAIDPQCGVCGDIQWLRDYPNGAQGDSKLVPCDACNTLSAQVLIKRAGIPERYKGATFKGIDRKPFEYSPLLREAFNQSLAFSKGEVEYQWLTLVGTKGWGKTHLACCILRYRADKKATGGLFSTWPAILDDLRNSYEEKSESTYAQILKKYQTVDLLIVDELSMVGREKQWTEEQVDKVFGFRYDYKKETVVTCNVQLSELKERVRDRILSERDGFAKVVQVWDAPSYRSGQHYQENGR
jgi:DNA replication protein DnaC